MYRHIVGYTFQAENYCPGCIVDQLPTGPGQPYDGWALAPGVSMPVEANLNEIAYAFGIDRGDETTFDSGDFPKVIFSSQLEDTEYCEACGGVL